MLRGPAVAAIVVLVAVLVAALLVYSYLPRSSTSGGPSGNSPGSNPQCEGTAACFTDTVTYIVDGDTLDVGSTRIRLALVKSPEVGQPGYAEAKQFTGQTCPVGSSALVDEDDGQTEGSYGPMIAVVYCGGANLNAAPLSEFATEPWTGCP